MVQLYQGHKPARPESRPIQNEHWTLTEQCWASIEERPPAEDVVSLLQGFLHLCPVSQPLCDFLRDIYPWNVSPISTTSSSWSDEEDVVFDGPKEEVSSSINKSPEVFRRN